MASFLKLGNGRVQFIEGERVYVFSGNEDVLTHPTNEKLIIIKDDGLEVICNYENITTPAVASRAEMIVELATKYFNASSDYTNSFITSVEEKFRGRPSVDRYLLGQRFNYPSSNVLHDICEFDLQRPKGNGDNYRIYTPGVNTYNLEVVSTNANDSNLVANVDAGVKQVEIEIIDSNWDAQTVIVDLNGTTPVVVGGGTPIDVRRVNDFHSYTTGEWGVARGDIELRVTSGSSLEAPWTGTQILGMIAQGGNKDMTAIFTVPRGKTAFVKSLSISSANSDQSIRLRSNTEPNTRDLVQYNCFLFQSVMLLGSNRNNTENLEWLEFKEMADIKLSCQPTNTGADSSCHLVMKLIQNPV